MRSEWALTYQFTSGKFRAIIARKHKKSWFDGYPERINRIA
jgi:hypothetical protein